MADFYSATVRAPNRFRGPISLRFLHVTTLRTRNHLQAILFISFDFHKSKGLPVEGEILAPKL